MKKDMYYHLDKILSYNKIINFVIGNRGGGKSYAAKKWCIQGFLKNKKQFVYLRRYNTEFADIKNWFSDVGKEYTDIEFNVDGGKFYINNEVAGYYMSLSTAQQHKSNSYPDVDKIIFDEFIIDKGRVTYLKNEVMSFLDLFETIARTRDDVRAVLISNAITSVNPYFMYFNIYPRQNDKFIVKGQTVTEIYKNDDFVKYKKETRFGQLIADTQYGRYNIENEFLRDNKSFIEKMSGKSICWYGLKYDGVLYTVWYNQPSGYLFVTKKQPSDSTTIYAITTDDHRPNMILLSSHKNIFKSLKEAYEYGQIRFDCLQSKQAFYEIINLI